MNYIAPSNYSLPQHFENFIIELSCAEKDVRKKEKLSELKPTEAEWEAVGKMAALLEVRHLILVAYAFI